MTPGPTRIKRRRALLAAGVAIAVAVAAGAFVWSGSTGGARADDPDQVRLGAAVYADHCAACHGARLEGQAAWQQRKPDGKLPAPPHDETGHTWHHPDRQLFAITKQGLTPVAGTAYATDMPAYRDVLTDRQIWAVLAFIKSRWPAEIQARQQILNRRRN